MSTTHSFYLVSFGILFPVETVPQADRRTSPPQGLISNHVPIYSLLIEGTRVGANQRTTSAERPFYNPVRTSQLDNPTAFRPGGLQLLTVDSCSSPPCACDRSTASCASALHQQQDHLQHCCSAVVNCDSCERLNTLYLGKEGGVISLE
ncbi:hypothetical protein K457DRAFT_259133 [Linnemannia elongata AG-77]|uniref:Uncharacterized protein n=1 Tax=Linnemannia elongata AG-77 TaxID=1314771 RepID=A0A197JF17_9FUNG|nr:hypothetical protein K457DRAFT_259133 [Linnemannia elongata AG-77]